MRSGIGLREDGVPDIVWCEIPRENQTDSGENVDYFKYGFKVSQFPITYAHFTAFVNSNGYDDEQFWSKKGIQWRKKFRRPYKPNGWNDPKWHIADHPVVGITWYEALAFSNWLNLRLRSELLDNWEIRLPTESEWEAVAYYPDGRQFPWGNTFEEGHANVLEANRIGRHYLQKTTPVDQYHLGANPAGVYDLVGNVWEWCLSVWTKKREYLDINDPQGHNTRVIRGCSFDTPLNLVSARFREGNLPYEWSHDIGFRIVYGPKFSNLHFS